MLPRSYGHYVLVERLADAVAGGSASEAYRVVAAAARAPERQLVLKRLRSDRSPATERAHFGERARQWRALAHVHAAALVDYGDVDGEPYVVVEHVDGMDLGRLLALAARAGTSMPPGVAVYLARAAARALACVHERAEGGRPLGLLHRNVAPRNLMVSHDGDVKLADPALDGAAAGAPVGLPLERLRYLAPEQLAGEPLDPRADLFALGLTLHEAIAGAPVVPVATAPSAAAVAAALRDAGRTPPSRLRPDVPAALDALVGRLLAPERGARFADAGELVRALAAFLDDDRTDDGARGRAGLAAFVARVAAPRREIEVTMSAREGHGEALPPARPAPGAAVIGDEFLAATEVAAAGGTPAEPPPPPSGETRPRPADGDGGGSGRAGARWLAAAAAAVVLGGVLLAVLWSDGGDGDMGPTATTATPTSTASAPSPPPAPPLPAAAPATTAATLPATASATVPSSPPPLDPAIADEPALVRGDVGATDFREILSAVDASLCTTPSASVEPVFPPERRAALQALGAERVARVLAMQILASGRVPATVAAAIDRALAGQPAFAAGTPLPPVSPLVQAAGPRTDGWALATLASLAHPGEARFAADLAAQRQALGAPRAGAARFPSLCGGVGGGGGASTIAPASRGAPVEVGGLRVALVEVRHDGAAERLSLRLRVTNASHERRSLALDGARLAGLAARPVASPERTTLAPDRWREVTLSFEGVDPRAARAAVLVLTPGVALAAAPGSAAAP